MIAPFILTVIALACIGVSAYRARRHLKARHGLCMIFGGLFLAAAGAAVITATSSSAMTRSFAVTMLAGIGTVIGGIHMEKTRGVM